MNNFELNPAEISASISFLDAGRDRPATHFFRPPKTADWLAYDLAINRFAEDQGDTRILCWPTESAMVSLWDKLALRTEGYGGFSEQPPENWKSLVPAPHKLPAVKLLAQVFSKETDEDAGYSFDPSRAQVVLEAGRSGQICSPLRHFLQWPMERQQKDFSALGSRTYIVRGSRTGKTLIPSTLKELVRLYDELILEVQGYTVNGQVPTRDQAVQGMDALHKQTVILGLFSAKRADSDAGQEQDA